MNITTDNLNTRIAATEAERHKLTALITERQRARSAIDTAIRTAVADLDAATPALAEALTREATGEALPGEVVDARAAIAAGQKAVATARKREGEAADVAIAENGLTARAVILDATLTDLYAQRADARVAVMVTDLHARIDTYTASAASTMAAFADVLALDAHLSALGKPQGMRTPDVNQAFLPGFPGHSLPVTRFDDLMASARQRVAVEHGSTR